MHSAAAQLAVSLPGAKAYAQPEAREKPEL